MKPRRTRSMRTRLLTIMLAASLVPTCAITIAATLTTYRKLHQDTIDTTISSMEQTQRTLDRFTQDMKEIFYAMEFDPNFKNAVISWSTHTQTYQDTSVITSIMDTTLNRNNQVAHLTLEIPAAGQTITVKRAGARIETPQDTTSGITHTRPPGTQTNLFFKAHPDGLDAIHNIHRFEDRALIAQLSANLQYKALADIIGPTRIHEHEQVLIINDQNEILFSIRQDGSIGNPDPTDDAVSPSSPTDKGVFAMPGTRAIIQTGNVAWTATTDTMVFTTRTAGSKLAIARIVPTRDLVSPVLPTVYTGLLVGITSAIAAIVFSIILSRIISRPMERLARRVRDISLHTLVLEEDDQPGSDEVGILEHHITLFTQRIRLLIRDEYDAKLQARTAQLKALQAQINPHFLHNTLQLMGSMALAKEAPEIYRISTALGNLMRHTMDIERTIVTLAEECRHLDDYLRIQSQRFADRFTVRIEIQEEARTCLVPNLILQPLVENSFTHGFRHADRPWMLEIRAWIDQSSLPKFLCIRLEDNGGGIPAEQLETLRTALAHSETGLPDTPESGQPPHMQHIGLANVHRRIQLLSTDSRCGLRIESAADAWTRVDLTIEATGRTPA